MNQETYLKLAKDLNKQGFTLLDGFPQVVEGVTFWKFVNGDKYKLLAYTPELENVPKNEWCAKNDLLEPKLSKLAARFAL